jgi:predicted acylesterase/phospholipase RssA
VTTEVPSSIANKAVHNKGDMWPPFNPEDLDRAQLLQVEGKQKLQGDVIYRRYLENDPATQYVQQQFDRLLELDPFVKSLVESLKAKRLAAVIIGGWVRDSLLGRDRGQGPRPHDIDLVVDGASQKTLATILPEPTKRTVFGGFTYLREPTSVDLWPLRETFLANHFGLEPSLPSLLRVTDFNVNSILFLPQQLFDVPALFDGGCIDALAKREVDFHFEWLTMPVVQVARLVHFASKLNFTLSEEVRRFIVSTCSTSIAKEQVVDNLDEHCPAEYLSKAKKTLESIVRVPKTRYFANCLGVFEGGGVRAAAFSGAFVAARKAGISFNMVAGTSGGSIAAALIATGADPDRIRQELFQVNFGRLASKADSSQLLGTPARWRVKIAPHIPSQELSDCVSLSVFGGLHSSKAIADWVEQALRDLLQSCGRPMGAGKAVTFKDLPIPLFVVASDLSTNKHRIWSKEATADASVAFAVRCSCTIPFYFQPVLGESAIFVDGGILSNTPAFIFAKEQSTDPGQYSPRILAFRLTQSAQSRSNPLASFRNLITSVSNTVTDGAGEIQRGLQGSVCTVEIDTGMVSSTDFDKIRDADKRFLFASGFDAVKAFVDRERMELRDVRTPNSYVGQDQQWLLYVQTLKDAAAEVVFIDEKSYWLYQIFPAVLAAASRGLRIRYLSATAENAVCDPDEHYRRRLLAGLGVEVISIQKIPFVGCLMDPALDTGLAAVVQLPRPGDQMARPDEDAFQFQVTKTYSATSDRVVFEYLYAAVRPTLPNRAPIQLQTSLLFHPCGEQRLFDLLRTVPQYRDATFSISNVNIDSKLLGTQTHIKEYKYVQTGDLMEEFSRRNVELFSLQELRMVDGTNTIITPPVVEKSGSQFIMIEGHARAYHCWRIGRTSFTAVIIDNISALPPTGVLPFSDISIASRTLRRDDQFKQLNPRLWRPIESCVHPTDWNS